MYLYLIGISSGTKKKLLIEKSDEGDTLMNFLHKNSIPIASSCRGEAVCQRCSINNNILSCTITVEDFKKKYGDEVRVDYM
jgi:Na+-transporting NADH:ubiquinone oxidoreductase subunit NqrF